MEGKIKCLKVKKKKKVVIFPQLFKLLHSAFLCLANLSVYPKTTMGFVIDNHLNVGAIVGAGHLHGSNLTPLKSDVA